MRAAPPRHVVAAAMAASQLSRTVQQFAHRNLWLRGQQQPAQSCTLIAAHRTKLSQNRQKRPIIYARSAKRRLNHGHRVIQHPMRTAPLQRLGEASKIARWGVSNLEVNDLEKLGPGACAANQVLYSPEARGIEFNLLSWCSARSLPVMAYSRIDQAGALQAVGARPGATPAQVAIPWTLRLPGVIPIPKRQTRRMSPKMPRLSK